MASSQVKNRLSNMKDELAKNTDTLAELDLKKKTLDSDILGYEAEVLSCTSKLSMLEKQLDAVEQEQEDIKQDISARSERLCEKEQEIGVLEGNQDEDEGHKVNLEDKAKTLAGNITEAEVVLEDHKRRLRVLSSLVEKREEESEKNQERISKTKEKLEKVTIEISQLEQDETQLSEHEYALRDELRDINAEYLEVDNEYENFARQRTTLDHEINEKTKKIDQLNSEYKKQKEIFDELMESIKEL